VSTLGGEEAVRVVKMPGITLDRFGYSLKKSIDKTKAK
jgi:hypothetical protein